MSTKELVEVIARALVDHPEQVDVRVIEGVQSSMIEIRVAPEDQGQLIGRRGWNIGALRTIASAASMKNGKKVILDVIEEKKEKR